MFSKIFTFSNATLLVALTLSSIAAWYSIIGLTAIFAAAVIPIIIMGSALELAKVVTTVWLRKYWNRCSWILKLYLVSAVILLAFLTSMGIFGFLSKAHTDQSLVSGDVQSKLAIYDEKIKTARENIEANRKQLKQMDEAVDQVMARSTTEEGATKANNIRRSQQRDRVALAKDIEANQKLIASLNDESAPIRAEIRKVEAEVGPIKYIAALIYGDDPDKNLLERAVRWVIIILVIVFDPLALMLVIAGNQSKEWDKEEELKQDDKNAMAILPPENAEIETRPFTTEEIQALDDRPKPSVFKDPGEHPQDTLQYEEVKPEVEAKDEKKEPEVDPYAYLKKPFVHFTNLKPMVARPEDTKKEEKVEPEDTTPMFEGVKIDGEWVQTGPTLTKKPYVVDENNYVAYDNRHMPMAVFKELYPELALQEDGDIGISRFGTEFPKEAKVGETFVRVDAFPNRTYKFNGTRWIEINKELTDVHLSNEYLEFLVEKIGSGEYDPEILSANEQQAVEEYIRKQNG